MDELMKQVPRAFQDRFTALVTYTDSFCSLHLNDEYKVLCQDMAACLCRKGSPAAKGKPEVWAAAIVHAIGWVNFLDDPSQSPHMPSAQIAKEFGVSSSIMMAKSRTIRQGLRIDRFDPNWCVPSMADKNPLVWMLKVDGMIVDIRSMPREAQAAAFEKGLIPYIPADRE